MPAVPAEVQIRLAQILSILAAIATLSVWRANALPDLRKQRRLLGNLRSAKLGPNWVPIAYTFRSIELALWLGGLSFSCGFLWKAADYFFLTNSLVGGSKTIDYGLMAVLQSHSADVKDEAVYLGLLSFSMLFVQWVLQMILPEWRVTTDLLSDDAHPFVVPTGYRRSELALWEQRIQRTAELTDSPTKHTAAKVNGTWRDDWAAWTMCVTEYHSAVRRDFLRRLEKAGRTSG
jgi:hypothetical protein